MKIAKYDKIYIIKCHFLISVPPRYPRQMTFICTSLVYPELGTFPIIPYFSPFLSYSASGSKSLDLFHFYFPSLCLCLCSCLSGSNSLSQFCSSFFQFLSLFLPPQNPAFCLSLPISLGPAASCTQAYVIPISLLSKGQDTKSSIVLQTAHVLE